MLPARAGEVIRPYFLARHEHMSATGAFATIILERLLDMLTVLVAAGVVRVRLRSRASAAPNPTAFAAVKWAGATAGGGALAALVVLFVLAGDPARLGRTHARGSSRSLPSTLAGLIARDRREVRARARRDPAAGPPARRARCWSFPLWLSIAPGIWAVADGVSASRCRSPARFC